MSSQQESTSDNESLFVKTKLAYIIDWITVLIITIIALIIEFEAVTITPNQYFIPQFSTAINGTQSNVNIQYPKRESTVNDGELIVICFIPAILLFIISAVILYIMDSANYSIKTVLLNFELLLRQLLLSFSFCLLITDIIKIITGIPRPYYQALYNEVINNNLDKSELNDGRYSFPSGHSSLPMAVNGLLVIFLFNSFKFALHCKDQNTCINTIDNPNSYYFYMLFYKLSDFKILLGLIILFPIYLSFYSGLSRIVDYKHYPVDVVSGFILGFCIAILVYNIFYDEMYGKFNYNIAKKKFDVEMVTNEDSKIIEVANSK